MQMLKDMRHPTITYHPLNAREGRRKGAGIHLLVYREGMTMLPPIV